MKDDVANIFDTKLYKKKILRADYYWPTIETDTTNYVRKCERCQKCRDIQHAPANELHHLASPWPLLWWGIDIQGHLP